MTKTKKKSAPIKEKAAPSKKPEKAPKTEKKAMSAAQAEAPVASASGGMEDLEAMMAGGAAGAGKGPVAEGSAGSLKNFRHHPDMENFYRFIYENDLRFEALAIIDEILLEKANEKKLKLAKSAAH